ncbi:MAG: DUF1127 domain-containing protein [Pseudomonadota bacterium]
MTPFSSTHAALALFRRRRSAAKQVRQELGAMTSSELNDLGLSPVDIDRIAREAAAQVV